MLLFDCPDVAGVTILLAHGGGAPMDSASMSAGMKALAAADFRIARFEFGYIARHRTAGAKRLSPLAEALQSEYISAINDRNLKPRKAVSGFSAAGHISSIADRVANWARMLTG